MYQLVVFFSFVRMMRGKFYAIFAANSDDRTVFATIQGWLTRGRFYNVILALRNGRAVAMEMADGEEGVVEGEGTSTRNKKVRVYDRKRFGKAVRLYRERLLRMFDEPRRTALILRIGGSEMYFERHGNMLAASSMDCIVESHVLVFGPFVDEDEKCGIPHQYFTYDVFLGDSIGPDHIREFHYDMMPAHDGVWNPNLFYEDLREWITSGRNADMAKVPEEIAKQGKSSLVGTIRCEEERQPDGIAVLVVKTSDGETHRIRCTEAHVAIDATLNKVYYNLQGGFLAPSEQALKQRCDNSAWSYLEPKTPSQQKLCMSCAHRRRHHHLDGECQKQGCSCEEFYRPEESATEVAGATT